VEAFLLENFSLISLRHQLHGDFLQFYWWSPAAGMALTPTATGSNPTRPASPSVNVNVFNVAG
jgi:hypothetical protein